MKPLWSRRDILAQIGVVAAATALRPRYALAAPAFDATFIFVSDIHACRMNSGLSPNCQQEGKTDENLLRHIRALNGLATKSWPTEVAGVPSGLVSAGKPVGEALGLIVGGDMTDDGGGQVVMPGEGTQLLQFSQRYQQGVGDGRVHVPVYLGLGNHDLDQDGPPAHIDWYRRELRDYVEMNHRPGVFFHPPVPAGDYDIDSDSYSWDWGGLHLVQTHRFAGDIQKGVVSGLPWLKSNLARFASDGRPVILFQHYGWDAFSRERWDPSKVTFDDEGKGAPHWWSEASRDALVDTLSGYNIVALFHGHQHETPMIYKAGGLDIFKPKAAFLGGFALARAGVGFLDVVLGQADGEHGDVIFTNAFTRRL